MDVTTSLQAWKRWTGVLQRVRECECTAEEEQWLEEESLAWTGWLDATKKLAADAGTQEALGAATERLVDAAERWVVLGVETDEVVRKDISPAENWG